MSLCLYGMVYGTIWYYMVLPGFSGRVAASQVYVDALLAPRRPALDSHFLLSRLSALLCKARPGTPREPKGVGDAP